MFSHSSVRSRISFFGQILIGAILFLVPLIFDPTLFVTFELPKVVLFRALTMLAGFLFILKLFFEESFEFSMMKGRRGKIFWIAFSLYILSFVLGTIFSVAPEVSFFGSYYRFQGLLMHLHYWLFFALILVFFDKTRIWVLVRCLMWSAVFVAVLGAIQWFFPSVSGFWDVDSFLGRIFSTLGHPNYLATYLVMTFPFFLLEIFQKRGKTFWIVGALLLVVVLFLTKGRAAVLGFFVSSWIFSLAFFGRKIKEAPKKNFRRKIFWMLFVGPIVLLGLFLGILQIAPKAPVLNRFVLKGENLRSIETRLVMWPAVLRQIGERPIFGSGPETFFMTFPKYAPKELLRLEDFEHTADRAHNEFLDQAATTGVFGLLSYLFLIGVLFWMGFFAAHSFELSAASGVLALLIANQFGFSTTIHYVTFWLLAAIILLSFSERKNFPLKFLQKKWVGFFILVASGLGLFFAVFSFAIRSYLADSAFRNSQDAWNDADFLRSPAEMTRATLLAPHESFYPFTGARTFLDIAESLPPAEAMIFFPSTEHFLEQGGKITSFRDFQYYFLKGKFLRLLMQSNDPSVVLDSALPAHINNQFEQASVLAPHSPAVLMEWGKALLDLGDGKNALAKFEQYLSLAPEYWQLKGKKDLSASQQNQLRIFYKLNPGFDEIFELLVMAAKQAGEKEKAEYYGKFVEQN